MSDIPSTPRCDEWAQTVRAQVELLQDFNEWFRRSCSTMAYEGYPLPGRTDFECFLEQERGFDFAELERERRALLEYQRELNRGGFK